MSYVHKLLFYQTITPLHVGCGQDVGVVDLPVIRERTTGYPFIPGSGIRGSLRDVFENLQPEVVADLFGPTAEESDTGPRYAGCVAVHDARLLLFPVRSDQAPFVWITCPAVLSRFSRDLAVLLSAADAKGGPGAPWSPPGDEQVIGPFQGKVHLEEFEFTGQGALPVEVSSWLTRLAGLLDVEDLGRRTVLVSDRSFHHFVTHATQVLQHNRLDATKVVASGQLFSVEAVPPETVFYGFLGATQSRRPKAEGPKTDGEDPAPAKPKISTREEALAALVEPFAGAGGRPYLQLGGDEGTGLGVTRLAWTDGIPAEGTAEGAHAS